MGSHRRIRSVLTWASTTQRHSPETLLSLAWFLRISGKRLRKAPAFATGRLHNSVRESGSVGAGQRWCPHHHRRCARQVHCRRNGQRIEEADATRVRSVEAAVIGLLQESWPRLPPPVGHRTSSRLSGSWKLSARTAVKTLEACTGFRKFCVEWAWFDKNPAKAIKPGKVEDAEILPFSQSEVDKILKACDSFNGNGKRIGALANLMLATGLRIGDASTISRERFVKDGDSWRVVLRTAKSGTSVSVPVQEKIVKDIQTLPSQHPFWSGESTSENCSSVWQEAFRKLFKHAGVAGIPTSSATRLRRTCWLRKCLWKR